MLSVVLNRVASINATDVFRGCPTSMLWFVTVFPGMQA